PIASAVAQSPSPTGSSMPFSVYRAPASGVVWREARAASTLSIKSDSSWSEIYTRLGERRAEAVDAAPQRRSVGRADHEVGADAALAEERVAADLALGVRLLDRAQQVGDLALGHPAADRLTEKRRAAFERAGQRIEHLCADVRHAGHQVDVADLDPRRARHA